MDFTPSKINWFLLAKLPSAYFSGVRVSAISDKEVEVKVRFRWINQNPFKSMYWATQGMASELATGMLLMKSIEASGERFSMLVTHQEGRFLKKAKGLITFKCNQQQTVLDSLNKAILTKEPQIMTLSASGFDESGEEVSNFNYEWSIKLK